MLEQDKLVTTYSPDKNRKMPDNNWVFTPAAPVLIELIATEYSQNTVKLVETQSFFRQENKQPAIPSNISEHPSLQSVKQFLDTIANPNLEESLPGLASRLRSFSNHDLIAFVNTGLSPDPINFRNHISLIDKFDHQLLADNLFAIDQFYSNQGKTSPFRTQSRTAFYLTHSPHLNAKHYKPGSVPPHLKSLYHLVAYFPGPDCPEMFNDAFQMIRKWGELWTSMPPEQVRKSLQNFVINQRDYRIYPLRNGNGLTPIASKIIKIN
jgi:hypothetical protein